ncbi:ABC transporter ATP-binding protein [Roseibium sp. Sym1]|uniref:ABC transporter ATP-binding protein n=1 Tax=Roseibium sp. Sym1 TaxID=3016006 RepID=UPI0022B32990|nr:ABC transporter ATP-binding protein [Roseibium sp. Sym1]
MSCEVSVKARGLEKRYNLFDTDLGALAGLVAGRDARKHHWALRDFDLDAKAGDFIGIVGRNGAGKSTLLQIIAGILTPDAGTLEIKGRVTALLELGAGFNPDFTGRENVELSAALYGLSSGQITQRIDAITEFAGLNGFMDRPTREYSSGMLAKLAFSVCLHVDADIVIVDELFGVGDFRFRQRATRRLLEFSKDGIVFFVSHNEATVLSLCNRAVFIEDGRKVRDGSTKSVYRAYQRLISRLGAEGETFRESGDVTIGEGSPGNDAFSFAGNKQTAALSGHGFYDRAAPVQGDERGLIASVDLKAPRHADTLVFEGGEHLLLEVHTREIDLRELFIAILLKNAIGQTVCARDTLDFTRQNPDGEGARVFGAEFDFPLPFLPSGDYAFDVAIGREDNSGNWIGYSEAAVEFSVLSRHVSDGLANIAMDDVTISPVDGS